jgi:hypothetical protein
MQTILTGAAPAMAIAVAPHVVSGVLQQSRISSTAELQGRTVAQLKSLASSAGISSRDIPDRKEAIVEALARAAGFEAMRPKEKMIVVVQDMMARLRNGSATVDQIKREAEQYLPDELEKVDHDTMKELAKLLALSFRNPVTNKAIPPSRKAIVMALTGARSQTSLSREGRKSLRSDRNACRIANTDEVRLVAKSHNIPTFGVGHVELCDKLYAQYLTNASELVLGSAEKLNEYSRMSAADRQKKIRSLVAQLHLDVPEDQRIETISQLLNYWVLTHYRARTMNLYPRLINDVERYFMDGSVPDSASDRHSLGVIFSDLDRTIPSMADNNIASALDSIYTNFLVPLATDNDAHTLEVFNQYRNKVGFGTYSNAGSPPRTRARSPTPVRSSTSPRTSMSSIVLPPPPPSRGNGSRPTSPRTSTSPIVLPQGNGSSSPLIDFGSIRINGNGSRTTSPRAAPLPPSPRSSMRRNGSPPRTPTFTSVLPATIEELGGTPLMSEEELYTAGL